MTSRNNKIGGGRPMRSPLDMVDSGELPRWTCDAWRKNSGIDPRLGIKIADAFHAYAHYVVFLLILVCISLLVFHYSPNIERTSPLKHIPVSLLYLAVIVGFVEMWFYHDQWKYLDEKYGRGFNWAFHWLLTTHPMTQEEFPRDIDELKSLWLDLIPDLALLILQLEKSGDAFSAREARTELRMLVDGARWYGFLKARKKGVGIAFKMAKGRSQFGALNVDEWRSRKQEWRNECLRENRIPGMAEALE